MRSDPALLTITLRCHIMEHSKDHEFHYIGIFFFFRTVYIYVK